ncbi:hypothetical protein EMCRGX_G028694 [Ephydatia muelleri]
MGTLWSQPSTQGQLDYQKGRHALTCNYNGDVVSRHNRLRDALFESCRQAGVGGQMETYGCWGAEARETLAVETYGCWGAEARETLAVETYGCWGAEARETLAVETYG